jgi:hypothetical protein
MIFLTFAFTIFGIALAVGVQAGTVGTLIGLVVGLAMGSLYYLSLIGADRWRVRQVERWWPGVTADPSRHIPLSGYLFGFSLWLALVVWFVIFAACAAWFTAFLVQRW